ncbi:MAG: protein kinase [bacterium]
MTTIRDFEPEELIGEGQAETYRGREVASGTWVLVKVLKLDSPSLWKGIELFAREVRSLEQLQHPQIPRLLASDLGAEDPSRFVLVQTWVDGKDLRSCDFPDENSVIEMARQVLSILAYLQSFSPPIIHRDIKPANIVKSGDLYHLVDFGAVQLVTPADEGGSTIVGTSGYLPPEQLMGRAEPSSDLFGLGMTMVRLLTGREPDELPVHRLRTVWENAKKMPVSPRTERFINTLIAPHAADRFADAATALAALPGDKERALVRRPSNTTIQVHRTPNELRVVKEGTFGHEVLVLLALPPCFLAVVLLAKLAWPVAIGLGIPILVISLKAAHDAAQRRRGTTLTLAGVRWELRAGRKIRASGPISQIRDVWFQRAIGVSKPIQHLALLTDEETHTLFLANDYEGRWLRSEIMDFVEER